MAEQQRSGALRLIAPKPRSVAELERLIEQMKAAPDPYLERAKTLTAQIEALRRRKK
jgi:hypothetical protein